MKSAPLGEIGQSGLELLRPPDWPVTAICARPGSVPSQPTGARWRRAGLRRSAPFRSGCKCRFRRAILTSGELNLWLVVSLCMSGSLAAFLRTSVGQCEFVLGWTCLRRSSREAGFEIQCVGVELSCALQSLGPVSVSDEIRGDASLQLPDQRALASLTASVGSSGRRSWRQIPGRSVG